MKRLTQILLAAITCIAANSFAQEAEVLWYNKISLEEGLSSQDYNFYVYTDALGFAWIGSSAGLNRFDGHTVKQYRSDFRDSTALFGENIQSRFFEDSRHNLWFCTYEAVHCYNRQRDYFQHYFIRNNQGEPLQEDYQVFCLEQDSLLWMRVGQQIYRVNISDTASIETRFKAAKPLFESEYYHFFTATNTNGAVQYVFGCGNEKQSGLECFEVKQGRLLNRAVFFQQKSPQGPELSIFQVYAETPEQVWLTTNQGLVKWNLMHPDQIKPFDFLFQGYSYLAPFGTQYLIVSFSNKGLFLFDKTNGHWAPYRLNPVKPMSEAVDLKPRNLLLDRNGVLWVTVPFEGVVYANPRKRKFQSIPNPDSLHHRGFLFRNFIEQADGQVWCSYNGGFLIFNQQGKRIGQIPLPAGINSPIAINYTLADGPDGIWVATNQGLLHYSVSGRRFSWIAGTEKMDILALIRLHNGALLASSLFGSIFEVTKTGAGWTLHDVWNAGGVAYTSGYEDRRGQVFICRNEAGIDVFSYGSSRLKLLSALPVRGAVNAYLEDPDGQTLWVGTSFGLVRINAARLDDTLQLFTEKDGLPHSNILSIASGHAGTLWLSTEAGLCQFDKTRKTFRAYSLADGALSKRFDKYAGLKLRNGDIWFGGSEGITVIPQRLVPDIDSPVSVLLTGLLVNDGPPGHLRCARSGTTNLNQVQQLVYASTENTLSFSFVAADYAYPQGTLLAYKLEGADKDWVNVKRGEAGFARYPNLPPGDYTFLVRGANSDGEWSKTPHRLVVTIRPPYWKTWWFLLLVGLAVLSLGGGWLYYRIKQFKHTEALKRRIAENKMAALIAQMNPHFIFNSLQSINGYILKNNRKQASEYLGRFSRLMRMILEGSRHAMHPIEKEKELLDLYLKVEAQRFKTPFHYEIDIDESLDTYGTQLPCMMLQPFVENAIWHGLSHRESPGFIQIIIADAGDLLKCTVSDNGVGRAKAAEIALQNGKRHESRAMQILSERLNLLFPGQQHLCSIRYTDLFDDQGSPAGTTVEISLPFIA